MIDLERDELMPTLTKTTDTPKAKRAPKSVAPSTAVTTSKTAPSAAPVVPTVAAMASVDVATFVALFRADSASLLTKIRLVGKPATSGATLDTVRKVLITALDSANIEYDKKSFSSAVSHYVLAFTLANSHKFTASDAALSAVYKLSHGAIPVKVLTNWVEKFSGSETDWIDGLKALALGVKASKVAKGAPAPKEKVTPESAPEVAPIPLSFTDILTELDKRLKAAPDEKTRVSMVAALARIVAKTDPRNVAIPATRELSKVVA